MVGKSIYKVLLLILILISLTACQKNDRVNVNDIYFPTNDEVRIFGESCGKNSELIVKEIIKKIREKELLNVEKEINQLKSGIKRDDPICVVARSPIEKFITTLRGKNGV